jgi:hypothetical protein
MVQEPGHAGFHDAVVDVVAVSSSIEDPKFHQLSQLVGYGLCLHPDGIGKVGHARIIEEHQGMEQAKACVGSQDLKESSQTSSLCQA